MSDKYVIICIPVSWTHVPVYFARSLFKVIAYGGQDGYSTNMLWGRSPFIDINRDELFTNALVGKPDYVLFLDADQTYPVHLISELAKVIDTGKLVAGGITPHRGQGYPMVWDWNEQDKRFDLKPIKRDSGIVKVGAMSFGGVMLSPKIVDEIPFPRFQFGWQTDYQLRIGEDMMFFKRCHEHGIDAWCNTAIVNEHLDYGAVCLKE
jgi:hypothetical protein